MNYANAAERQTLIRGLRELADFLEASQEIPAPKYADVLVFPPFGSDAEKRREVDVITSRIGSGIAILPYKGHYTASRQFGPVQYRAVAIPAEESKEQ